MPFNYVKTAVSKRWNLIGEFDMALDGELFYFKFASFEDRTKVLEEGSFHLAGKLFVIRPWTREVEQSREMIKSVPVWVKLAKVPKDLWNPKGFGWLGSAIGKPLFMDKTTEKGNMLSFARICIEVDANKELPSSIPLGPNRIVEVEYPWKPLICCKCKVFGHPTTKCIPSVPVPKPATNSWQPVGQNNKAPAHVSNPLKPSQPHEPFIKIGDSSKSPPNPVTILTKNVNNSLNLANQFNVLENQHEDLVAKDIPTKPFTQSNDHTLSAALVISSAEVQPEMVEPIASIEPSPFLETAKSGQFEDEIVQETARSDQLEDGTLHKLNSKSIASSSTMAVGITRSAKKKGATICPNPEISDGGTGKGRKKSHLKL
ncbi:zinc ion binding / nucleic acid binding protein [Thalictrum thalictroides]|uniref:Zinc ion binding / nucleic acid binding protein n=1 Tax=Thalictrum thalictroides TaxID=46969 RepID=A0A7J6X8C4_THATH|nr:zinc ion binding / nucleic acid binding protein [Thalictrum thalictroides]